MTGRAWRPWYGLGGRGRRDSAGSATVSHPHRPQRWLDAGGRALDPFVAMGFAAAHHYSAADPNIVVLPYRNPFVVAKSGATLDLLSGGRFT